MHPGVCKIQVDRYASGSVKMNWRESVCIPHLSTQMGGYVCFFSAYRDTLRRPFLIGTEVTRK